MSVLIRPLVTEKANMQSEKSGRYTFLVQPSANKVQIKEEVAKVYGVEVESVQTMIYAPKITRRYTKKGLQVGKSNKRKKAVVSLAQGQEIDIFSVE